MVDIHRVHLPSSPAALAKAKAFGVVAAAITAGGAGGMAALSHVAPASSGAVTVSAGAPAPAAASTTGTTDATSQPTEVASTEPARPEPTSTAYALPTCPGDATHGDYVRSVATGAPTGGGGEHGSPVSDAARSDCGKPTPAPRHPNRPAHTPSPRQTATPHHTASEQSRNTSGGDSKGSPAHEQATVARPTADATVGSSGHGDQQQGGQDH